MKNDAELSQTQRGVGLIGSTEPRVHTPLLKGKSKANEVADLAEKIGLPLIPWQRWVLEDLLTVNDDGLWVKRTGIILVSRQNGKTHLARMLILAHLFLWNTKNVLGMSSNRNMALDTFRQVSYTIEGFGCSPDGVVGETLHSKHNSITPMTGLIEIKCPNTATHIETVLENKAPSKYIPQMQCQMAVTGAKWCDFVSFDPRVPEDLQLLVVRVERDQEYIDSMEVEVKQFLSEVLDLFNQLKARQK